MFTRILFTIIYLQSNLDSSKSIYYGTPDSFSFLSSLFSCLSFFFFFALYLPTLFEWSEVHLKKMSS